MRSVSRKSPLSRNYTALSLLYSCILVNCYSALYTARSSSFSRHSRGHASCCLPGLGLWGVAVSSGCCTRFRRMDALSAHAVRFFKRQLYARMHALHDSQSAVCSLSGASHGAFFRRGAVSHPLGPARSQMSCDNPPGYFLGLASTRSACTQTPQLLWDARGWQLIAAVLRVGGFLLHAALNPAQRSPGLMQHRTRLRLLPRHHVLRAQLEGLHSSRSATTVPHAGLNQTSP
jgi:hypothetical protein